MGSSLHGERAGFDSQVRYHLLYIESVRKGLILIFLLVACGKHPKIGKISYPTKYVEYCLKGTVGENNIPFRACTPSKELCERGYKKALKFGSFSGLKVLSKCTVIK